MSAVNNVILVGRLTREPDVRQSATTTVARFGIAVNRTYKREGQPDADFFNCTAFGKRAEFVGKYLHKGTKIILNGQIQNDNYTNKQGQMVYGTQIIADDVTFAESKKAAQAAETGSQASEPASRQTGQTSAAPAPFEDDDFMNIPENAGEEIPFGQDTQSDIGEAADDLPFI